MVLFPFPNNRRFILQFNDFFLVSKRNVKANFAFVDLDIAALGFFFLYLLNIYFFVLNFDRCQRNINDFLRRIIDHTFFLMQVVVDDDPDQNHFEKH